MSKEPMTELLNEVERLRRENKILEKALENLGLFVRTKLECCATDFVGKGIDSDTDYECDMAYNSDEARYECYANCWADAFYKQAERDVKKMEE
ncbi:MAG TPA: hypothetical protein H9774_11950 [Candidatus Desulfovibrio gallistercoris]|nr:hypothetical protein [Candidatus Desulfovibrio gallistercoris]